MKIVIDQYELEIKGRNMILSDDLSDEDAKMFLNEIAVYMMLGSYAAMSADKEDTAELLDRKMIKIIDALNDTGFYDALRTSREEGDSDDC